MQIFHDYKKKKAIKTYINRMGKDLARRYGKSKSYTSAQVNKTAHDENYSLKHICYAHAMYTSENSFNRWHQENGENCDYAIMREEISSDYFHGDSAHMEAVCHSEIDFAGGAGGSSFAGD